jgi:pyruvate dehydrogenase E2 component (dihydrolipoamide acetyltransferase)
MQESLQTSAQLTHHMKVDITELLSLKKKTASQVEKQHNSKLTVTDFIARGVVLSLLEHKQMNSALIDNEIHIYNTVHLGIAVDVENGLVVPVVNGADSKSLVELSHSIKELTELAKTKQLKSDQMKGSTFTISNLGSYGIEYFTPILNSPETGILGVGTAQETPVFIGDQVQKRILLPLSLTFNHQVLDGAPAAQFLQTLKKYLEEPINLFL